MRNTGAKVLSRADEEVSSVDAKSIEGKWQVAFCHRRHMIGLGGSKEREHLLIPMVSIIECSYP
jgi:hypothetical protein